MLRKRLLTCAMAGLMTAGLAMARVYVRVAPPAPIVETRPPRPGPGYVWTPGYYNWDGSRYVWIGGRWVMPPHRHAHWEAGHWVRHRHNEWYFREGHWRG